MKEGIPVNQHPKWMEHQQVIADHFKFLVDELGFTKSAKWVSYEHSTYFSKEHINIEIMYCSADKTSRVEIVNTNLSTNEATGEANYDFYGTCNALTAAKIRTALDSPKGVLLR